LHFWLVPALLSAASLYSSVVDARARQLVEARQQDARAMSNIHVGGACAETAWRTTSWLKALPNNITAHKHNNTTTQDSTVVNHPRKLFLEAQQAAMTINEKKRGAKDPEVWFTNFLEVLEDN
jgi:hypothetical protein